MPIYAYKCAACGHEEDVLQKISDAPLTQCPHCGASAFSKQLTAAGFQLKGSGWYVTDFRNGSGAKKAAEKPGAEKPPADANAKPAETKGEVKGEATNGKSGADGAAKPTDPSSSPSPAPAPTPGSGGSSSSSS